MEKGKISAWQAAILTIAHPLGTGLFILPAVSINWAKEDAWFCYVLVLIPIMIIVFTIEKLGRMFPGKTIVQYSEIILGKYLGKILGFLIAYYFLSTGAAVIFQMASFMSNAIMPETPKIVFLVFTGAVIVYTVYKGLEIITRLNVWFFIVIVASLIFIFCLSINNMNLNYFQPFLANGLKPVLLGSLTPYGYIGCIFCMCMLIPYVNQPNKVKIPYLTAGVITTLIFAVTTMSVLTVLGPFEAGRVALPIIQVVKIINIANFFQHIEAILVLIWIGGVFTMSTGWFYFSVLGMAQTLNLKDYKPLILPMMIIYISASLLSFESYPEFVDWVQFTWPFYAFLFQIIIPVLLLIIATLRGLGYEKTDKKQRCDQV